MSILDGINGPGDLRTLSQEELATLAQELRLELIATVSRTGGHLAPSLGVVELTIALHRVFDSPADKIVWDVGHQCYVHKLLTGRRDRFHTIRQSGGLSGFPKREESPHDVFNTGHSSTSVSAALGLALARDLAGEDNAVVAVIGDGALTGGLAFEALNYAGHRQVNLMVVLNDNAMSIAQNVGALSSYLGRIRTSPRYDRGKKDLQLVLRKLPGVGPKVLELAEKVRDGLKYLIVPGILFEELGFTYLGPIDGHDLTSMEEVFVKARALKGPVLLHVLTKKGKGYGPAEDKPDTFHGIGPFDPETGRIQATTDTPTYTEVFADCLAALADQEPRLLAITAAMPAGTGLDRFAARFPDRFFDVGIAEQQAVTMAAGMAVGGLRPVVAVYSTFLQRAYDQVVHDVALQRLPVVLALDRAGLVGEDGETHHGLFDLAYLRHIPGMTVMAPKDENELWHMLVTACRLPGPAAIRYPRGKGRGVLVDRSLEAIPLGRAEVLRSGKDLAILAVGPLVYEALSAADQLKAAGVSAGVVNARFVKPLDQETLLHAAGEVGRLVTVEDHVLAGGFGSAVTELLAQSGVPGIEVLCIGVPDEFPPHGRQAELRARYGLEAGAIVGRVMARWGGRLSHGRARAVLRQ